MFRTEESWIKAYQEKGGYWEHDGNPSHPHAELTSGKHSNGFFNSRLVIPDEQLLREAASDLVTHFIINNGNIDQVDVIVGPQTGATRLAEFISLELGRKRGRSCRWASPAKAGEGANKEMIFTDPDHSVSSGDVALICDDVITTHGSVSLTQKAISGNFGGVLPFVLVLVNRSGSAEVETEVFAGKIISLICRSLPIWSPDDCPLCAKGSEAIRPKGPAEWSQLNDAYS